MKRSTVPIIAAAEFERAAQKCRWSVRSLAVARDILVDGKKISDVAKAREMSQQQAGIIRKRFLDHLQFLDLLKISADDFISQERPDSDAAFEPFKKDLLKLRRNQYSTSQLVEFLKLNGIDATAFHVDQYMSKVIQK